MHLIHQFHYISLFSIPVKWVHYKEEDSRTPRGYLFSPTWLLLLSKIGIRTQVSWLRIQCSLILQGCRSLCGFKKLTLDMDWVLAIKRSLGQALYQFSCRHSRETGTKQVGARKIKEKRYLCKIRKRKKRKMEGKMDGGGGREGHTSIFRSLL